MSRNRPTVFWVDVTLNGTSPELQQAFGRHCEIRRTGDIKLTNASLQLICFEYDCPDLRGLQLLQRTKTSYPSLPILMVTLQHSEALAVWAFRTRVWDYLVKPCAPADIDRVCAALKEVAELRTRGPSRSPVPRASSLPTEVRFLADSDRNDVRPALEYIHANFAEKISEQTVAELCGMNRFKFSRMFSKILGITFNEYLVRYRIGEACRLFRNPGVSVTDVALMVGFSDLSHFGRMFKRECGVLPSTYRASVVQAPGLAERPSSGEGPLSGLCAPGLLPDERLEPARLAIPLPGKALPH